MHSLEKIRKLGFRRWYERQLVESYAYFVTCFVCMILVASALEAFNTGDAGFNRFLMVALAAGGAALGVFSWKRYLVSLALAEHLADCAVCLGCKAYAAFEIIGTWHQAAPAADDEGAWLRVRCRKCAHEWTLR